MGLLSLEFLALFLSGALERGIITLDDMKSKPGCEQLMFFIPLWVLAVPLPPSSLRAHFSWRTRAHATQRSCVILDLLHAENSGNEAQVIFQSALESLAKTRYPVILTHSLVKFSNAVGTSGEISITPSWLHILAHAVTFSSKMRFELLQHPYIQHLVKFLHYLTSLSPGGHIIALLHEDRLISWFWILQILYDLITSGSIRLVILALHHGILTALFDFS
ncbi:hypothetical protein GYMLUDRAFT_64931 [Collybiopsis luxurians FD-317 M1]|uniref:Uncharacterized protein n=1 Tax=Collybiopsis luxurians FD-317 M1 TaxID=944289 RepID=A0A0D0BAD2_9AGAR|nr:hypothetical protein GYMLUDRAFT_64931 [Collybiopsis luxurians FD-317 M1]